MRVVVVGGGYGGAALAAGLDHGLDHGTGGDGEAVEVVLVEPKDAFVHASAALRAVVDPTWADRVFLPYERLLRRGEVVHDWARLVSPGRVRFSADREVTGDVVVLATGTAYPFPAKFLETEAEVAVSHLDRLRETLRRCTGVLLVGGGPVGVELAGELTSAFPGLEVTIVEQAPDILTSGDYLPELRAAIREQLEARGVRILCGAPLGFLPPFDIGKHGDFVVETTAGEHVHAQMWFRCYGARPVTDYLDGALAAARRHDGALQVDEHLRVLGQERVFAIGDITDVPESKRASAAREHAAVVARNVRDLAAGRPPSATYSPAPERVVLPLGPEGGAAQLGGPEGRHVVGPEVAARIKGHDLFAGSMAELFGRV